MQTAGQVPELSLTCQNRADFRFEWPRKGVCWSHSGHLLAKLQAALHVSRARRSTKRSEVVRCRTGTFADAESGTIPDQRETVQNGVRLRIAAASVPSSR